MSFNNNILLTIIIYLPIAILMLVGCKFQKNKTNHDDEIENYFNFDDSLILKGLFTIIIFLHHVSIRTVGTTHTVMLPFTQLGYIGVSGFLFISGYVEHTGLQKRSFSPPPLATVLIKKITRIILPFAIINILIGIVYMIFQYRDINIVSIITSTLFVNNVWNSLPNWYVIAMISLLFIYYLIAYISKFFISLKKHIPLLVLAGTVVYISVCIICKADEYWYNSAFAFVIGVFTAEYKKQIFAFFRNSYYFKLIICWLCMLGIWGLGFFGLSINSIIHSVASILFAICISISFVRLNLKGKLLKLVGKVSYEHFLMQSAALILVYDYLKPQTPFFVLIMFVGILILCLPLQSLFKIIQNRIIRKKI